MELKVWVKTFFSIFRWLERLTKAIDDYVLIRGTSCYYKNLSSITLCSTTKVVNDITGLMNKKINLINIKILIEKMLQNLSSDHARFVVAKYVDNHTFEETAQILEVSTRTALRWNLVVLEKCGKYLKSLGYTDAKLKDLIGHEKWVLAVAKKLKQEDMIKHTKKLSYFAILHEAEKEYKSFMI